jgi:PAS domain S-box-containing protein
MARALQEGAGYNGQEIVVERPDGSRVTALAHANPIRDDSGRVVGAVNVLVDISHRDEAADVHAILAAIVESSDDAIVSKDLNGRILSWNAGAERLFGYSANEAIGRSITLIIPPDRHDEERGILARLRRGERIEHFETVRVTKDGRPIDISLTVSPLRDRTGRVVGASKVARDMTARKRSEQQLVHLNDELSAQLDDLRRLHEMSIRLTTTLDEKSILEDTVRTATAVEGTDLGLVFVCDPEHTYLDLGAGVGLDDELLRIAQRVSAGTGASGRCLQEQRRVIVEDVEKDPDFEPYREGARRVGFRAVHSTPLVTRSGKLVGVLTTLHPRPGRPSYRQTQFIDLCARQAAESIENARLYAQLREADRRKDEFLATLAHELRNPLAPVRNAVHLLHLQAPPGGELKWPLQVIDRQMAQMTRLIDDLMDVSRITRGKLQLRMQRVELGEIIRAAVETSRPNLERGGHELIVNPASERIYLEADPTRVAQALSNLLNNAAKYMEWGGRVWLTAERQGSDAVLKVRDTGIGIPPEMLPRIFEMFTQVDRSMDRAQGGLGIGLTLVKRLVEMHGGSVQADSEGPGKGSEFTIRLPVALTAAAAPVPVQSPVGEIMIAPLRILVVDDNRDAAATLAMLLRMNGNDVRTVHDGREAVTEAREFRPDLAILDIGLPGLTGYEAARVIRQESWGAGVVLIAITGWAQDVDRQRSMEAGFDHHLVKPVEPAALLSILVSLQQSAAAARGLGPSPRH